MDMNSVNLVGRLAEDIKFTAAEGGSTPRATGRLIVHRTPGKDGKQNYDAIPIVAWGPHAENLAKYSSKGKELGVTGHLRVNNVQNQDGSWKNFFEVMVVSISLGRDSNASKVLKASEVSNVSAATLGAADLKALLNHPEIKARMAQENIKSSAMPEGARVFDNVLESPGKPSAVAENPFAD